MRRALLAAASAFALVGGAISAHAAAYTFTPIVDPAAPVGSTTFAVGVNDLGQVAGYYASSGNGAGYGGAGYSFVETAGAFANVVTAYVDPNSSFEPSPLSNMGLHGINNVGQALGYGFNGIQYVAYIEANGIFSPVSIPSSLGVSPVGFFAAGFNDSGQIVGAVEYVVSLGRGQQYTATESVLDSNGTFSVLSAPSVNGVAPSVFARDINNAGQIVGFYGSGLGGFLDAAGVFTPVNVPGATPGSTVPLTISNTGEIAGSYTDATGTHGFVDDNGVYTVLFGSDVSGTGGAGLDNTVITGINAVGDLVLDSNGGAFFATPASVPVPEPGSATLLGASLAGLGFVLRRRRTGA